MVVSSPATDALGIREVWTSDADGANASAMTAFRGPITERPKWSPDGRFIASDSRAGLPSGPSDRWSVATGTRDGSDQIFKAPAKGAERRRSPVAAGGPKTSSDGARIYYARDVTIWSVATAGGDGQRVEGLPRCSRGTTRPGPSDRPASTSSTRRRESRGSTSSTLPAQGSRACLTCPAGRCRGQAWRCRGTDGAFWYLAARHLHRRHHARERLPLNGPPRLHRTFNLQIKSRAKT